ncbi:hypothetical protein R6Q59_033940 [Mikania micrantha]
MKMRSKTMMVYLSFIILCNLVILSYAVYNDLSHLNSPTLQNQLNGVLEAKIGLNCNKNKAQHASKYALKEGQKGGHRGDAHSGGGGGSLDRNHHVPRNVGQSKFTMSFGITFGSFFLLIFAF